MNDLNIETVMHCKIIRLSTLLFIVSLCSFASNGFAQKAKPGIKRKYDVAAFLYPAYASNDPRLRPFWPAGNGEWETHPLITINSWNEWTETSYLQPDNVYGYGYLEAIKKIFVDGYVDK